MLEKMNEPTTARFNFLLLGVFALFALPLLGLFTLAKIDESNIKNTPWYKQCAEEILPANANPTPNTYQVTQICWQTARYGLRANKYLTSAIALSSPEQKEAIETHLRKAKAIMNCGKRRCRPQENAS